MGFVDQVDQTNPMAASIETTVIRSDRSLEINEAPPAQIAEDQIIEEEAQTPRAAKHQGPPRQMLVNVTGSEEVRIAILAEGMLEELYVERSSTELHVGNIYKGKVVNVEPSIQAAFIDFGIGKNGFLHISDVHPQYFPASYRTHRHTAEEQKKVTDAADESMAEAGEAENAAPGEAPEGVYGDFDAMTDLGQESLEVENQHIAPMEKVGRKTPRHSRPPIQQCFKRGQEVFVQVTKEGIGTKGPTLTSYVSIAGRYLVMMPGMSHLGVSRKIENDEQRRELRKLMQELNPPKNLGFIVRTAGIDRTLKELQQDLHYLVRIWKLISQRIQTLPAPAELYQESDLVIRTIRDLSLMDIERIVVDDAKMAEKIRDFVSLFNPKSAEAVQVYDDPMPLFQRYNVEREIEKINSRRVEMANGGSLVIDSAEALVAIDVNSGRYREQRNAEMTAFNINKDAIKEICRQLRLRDLGGVIVIDFIDMREEKHKREIERLLKNNLKNDRAKTKVLRMSLFCMIEMTRQRVKASLKRSIYQDCPHCHGSGLIKTPESISLDVIRRLTAGTLLAAVNRIDVRVHSTVATYLLNRNRRQLVELEERSGRRIGILPDAALAGDAVLIEAYDSRGNLMNVSF